MREIALKGCTLQPVDEYKEVSTTFRHYSNLRYAVLTVFIAISAALVGAVHGKDASSLGRDVSIALKLFGIFSALAFLFIEYLIDDYLTNFSNYIEQNFPQSHWVVRPKWARRSIAFATRFPQAAIGGFWIYSLFMLPLSTTTTLPSAIESTVAFIRKTDANDSAVVSIESAVQSGANESTEIIALNHAASRQWRILFDMRTGTVISASSSNITAADKSCDSLSGAFQIQASLKALGLLSGRVDGVIGPQTMAALRFFQQTNGLSESGRPDLPTTQLLCRQALNRNAT